MVPPAKRTKVTLNWKQKDEILSKLAKEYMFFMNEICFFNPKISWSTVSFRPF